MARTWMTARPTETPELLLAGLQEERIFIEVSSSSLAERGLSALDIQAALAGQNAMDPAGRIETSERSVRIDVQGGLRSVDDIRELRLRAGQQTFRLGDIAEVRRGLEDPPSARTRYQGREAVLLGTTMAPGSNVTEVGAVVERTLKGIEKDLPVGIELGKISDQAQVVSTSIHQFLEALAEAIGIVLVVSLLALGTALASVMGTTGAAMLFIRPLLAANEQRRYRTHLVIFFIVLVGSISGLRRLTFTRCSGEASTALRVTSAPVPAVVGTAMTGRGGLVNGSARPMTSR